MTTSSIILDQATAARVNQEGFAVVNDITSSELQQLQQCYERFSSTLQMHQRDGLHMTNWMPDGTEKIEVRNSLELLLRPIVKRVFGAVEMTNPVFIVKYKHRASSFPLHQDWSFVDEEKYPSYNFWIALDQTHKKNGALVVIPGSHQLPNTIRGPGALSSSLESLRSQLQPFERFVPLEAGQAIIFPHRLIHGSPPNTTSKPRRIVSVAVHPIAARVYYHHWDEASAIMKRYPMPADFSYNADFVQKTATGKLPHTDFEVLQGQHPKQFTADEILPLISRFQINKSFMQKLRNVFPF